MNFVLQNFRWISAGFVLLFASTFGQTLFISLSGQNIRDSLNLSSGEFGSIYMIVTLASAAVMAALGSIIDKYRLNQVVLLSGLGLAIGAMLIGFATNIYLLVASLFLLRLFGQGMFINIAFTAMGRWFSRERGRASAVAALGFNAGEAVLPLAFVFVAALYDWRIAWISASILLLLVLVPASLYGVSTDRVVSSVSTEPKADEDGWTQRQVLTDPIFYVLLLGMLVPPTMASALFFHQSSIAIPRGWAPEVFASSITVYATVAMISVLIAGSIIDRVGALKVFPFHLFPLAVGCWLVAYVQSEWSIFAFMALYAITEPVSLTLAGTLWPQVYGIRHLGAIRGMFAATLSACTALGPGLSGILIDAGVSMDDQLVVMGWYCTLISPILVWAAFKAGGRLTATVRQ